MPSINGNSLFLFLLSLVLGVPVVTEYLKTGLVPRFPTAILSSSLMICAFISFLMGVILESVSKVKKEVGRANYLKY